MEVAEGDPGQGAQLLVPEPGPKSWVSGATLICKGDATTGRRPCRYYAPMLTEADGKIVGFAKPKQIHRFCLRLASQSELMKIGETSIYACYLREPVSEDEMARRDPNAVRMIEEFEAKQERMTHEAAREAGDIDVEAILNEETT